MADGGAHVRGVRSPWHGVALVAACVTFVVVAAGFVGRWELTERFVPLGGGRTTPPPPESDPGSGAPTAATATRPPNPFEDVTVPDLTWVWVTAVIVVALVVVALALRYLAFLRRPLAEAPSTGARLAVPTGAETEPDLPVLQQGVAAAQAHLAEIREPRDAIIAAWLALEDAAQRSGIIRRPAQTPSEFTAGVLARTSADPQATSRLLHLYHRARFGTAPPEPADVAAASVCLGEVASSWSAFADSGEVEP